MTCVVLFTQSFRFLSFVIDNSSTILIFLQLMGLLIPTFLPLIVPLGLGIAVLFIYYKFAVDSEIVVMRAVGISSLKLAMPALVLAVIVTFFGYLLTTWIAPAANRELVALQYRVRDNFSVFLVRPGNFNDIAEGLTFYVRARGNNGELQDILVHDVRNPEKPVTIMAESGQFTANDNDPQILVFKGKRQEIDTKTGRLSQLDFERYVLDLKLLRSNMGNRLPDPREMTMKELFNPPRDPAKRRTTLEHIYAELHQRLASPLLALTYTLISLTVILAGEFNRRGMMRRILAAAVSIIAVQAATLSIGSLIGKHTWLAVALYAVILTPVPICLAILALPGFGRRLFLSRLFHPFTTRAVPP